MEIYFFSAGGGSAASSVHFTRVERSFTDTARVIRRVMEIRKYLKESYLLLPRLRAGYAKTDGELISWADGERSFRWLVEYWYGLYGRLSFMDREHKYTAAYDAAMDELHRRGYRPRENVFTGILEGPTEFPGDARVLHEANRRGLSTEGGMIGFRDMQLFKDVYKDVFVGGAGR